MKKYIFKLVIALTLILSCVHNLFGQENLTITKDDLYIVQGDENGPSENGEGMHLFIRKKNGINSVMLVESSSTKDITNYAYRATEYNKINGDEKRILDGKFLESKYSKYSLISSTVEKNEKFGEAFHIYIPKIVVYGYPWARNGTIDTEEGLLVNIRSFGAKYCDYSKGFKDNNFMITKTKQKKNEKKTSEPKKFTKPATIPEPETFVEETVNEPEPIVEEPKEIIEEPAPVVEEPDAKEKTSKTKTFTEPENFSEPDFTDIVNEPEPVKEVTEPKNSVVEEVLEFPEEPLVEDSVEETSREEAERIAAEEAAALAEAERIAAEEEARAEAERLAAEEEARAEVERLAAEEEARAETERLAAEEAARAEAERLAAEEEARAEAERLAAEEEARAEAERLAAEEAARAEAERLAAEEEARAEAERLAAEEEARAAAERLAAEEKARAEAERLAAEEKARAEAERLAAEEEATSESESQDVSNLDFGITYAFVKGKGSIKDLYVSTTEITQGSYRSVMGKNDSHNRGTNYPVDSISWYDALVFCNTLSIKSGLTPCYTINGSTNPDDWGNVPTDNDKEWNKVKVNTKADGFRLLTEDEWIFAAKGGINKEKTKYSGSKDIGIAGWYLKNTDAKSNVVGKKKENSLGLYDMTGNLSEWVWDTSGKTAVQKGGNFSSNESACAIDSYEYCQRWSRRYENGLRICRLAAE